jgi:hypothetical protein
MQGCTAIVPATEETEAGGLLEFQSSRPAWATQLILKRGKQIQDAKLYLNFR